MCLISLSSFASWDKFQIPSFTDANLRNSFNIFSLLLTRELENRNWNPVLKISKPMFFPGEAYAFCFFLPVSYIPNGCFPCALPLRCSKLSYFSLSPFFLNWKFSDQKSGLLCILREEMVCRWPCPELYPSFWNLQVLVMTEAVKEYQCEETFENGNNDL